VIALRGLAPPIGSQTQTRSHRESDVDVAVLLARRVFGTNRERFEERLRLISAVGSALGRNDVDLVSLNVVVRLVLKTQIPETCGGRGGHARR